MMRFRRWAAIGLSLVLATTAKAAAPDTMPDLTRAFATRSAWTLSLTQGPETPGDDTPGGNPEPGEIRLCLRRETGPCDPQLLGAVPGRSDAFERPHYLLAARATPGSGGGLLLLVRTASLHSGNGDQVVHTQLLAYRPQADGFVRVYAHATGRNNNQEDRLLETGPLKGAMVSVEPTPDAPFGFWVTVSRPGPDGVYGQVLRYRSATRYGDGNPLAVIDSEMPGIQQRLGARKPGSPLPLPAGPCPRPHLVNGALWCR